MGIMEGDIHGHDCPATITIFDFQSRVLAIKLLQSCARVPQADTLMPGQLVGRKPGSIVLYSKFHRAIDLRRADHNTAGGGASSDAMANGVFHNRLQD